MHPLTGTLERHKSKEILNESVVVDNFVSKSMEVLNIEDEIDTNLPIPVNNERER